MAAWDAEQYLKFEAARTRPCQELVQRIGLPAGEVRTIFDLGCGPGNSTAVVMEKYPGASVIGMDSSEEMLAKARSAYGKHGWHFEAGDLRTWEPAALRGKADIVLSNATFQWIPDHAELFSRVMSWLRPGGVLAVQMPRSYHLLVLTLIRETAASGPWAALFAGFAPPAIVHDPAEYYNWLTPHAHQIDVWETVYQHVMPNADGVVEWAKGTGLRPYLERAGEHRAAFVAEYSRRVTAAYPAQVDGRVLMEFRRLMIVAQK